MYRRVELKFQQPFLNLILNQQGRNGCLLVTNACLVYTVNNAKHKQLHWLSNDNIDNNSLLGDTYNAKRSSYVVIMVLNAFIVY